MVRMNEIAVAEKHLILHRFSFGTKGGIQQIILAYTIALEINPS